MHVALCLHRVTPFGGLERNALALARAARERGHRVLVLARSFEGELPEGVEARPLPVRAVTNLGLDRAFERALGPALEEARPDVVVAFNRLRGADVFYAADPCYAATRGALSRTLLANRRWRAARERELAAPPSRTRIVVLTEGERRRFAAHHGTEPERLHVLPPGLRAEFLEPPAARERLPGLPGDALVCLALGADPHRKGLDRSLAALAALPAELRERTHLVAAGSRRTARHARMAARLGLAERVRFLPGTSEVRGLYRAADLFLHPAREENTGTVLLEAMSQCVPVVCSGACGFAPLVADADAGVVLAEPFEADALTGALAGLLADPERRRALGARGVVAARAYPLRRRTDALLEVIEEAARARARARQGAGA